MKTKTWIKQAFVRLYNRLLPTEDINQSKEKWNTLAKDNARYFVLSTHGTDISEDLFREEGEQDYKTLVAEDSFLKEALGGFSSKRVLEIGCGIGRLTEFFASDFASIVGIDISEEMINQGKDRLQGKSNISLVVGDGQTYPLPDASIDFVFSYIVFQHMPDTATVRKNFEEIARVLNKGGVAKIQLRGVEVKKGEWFYGPSFTHAEAMAVLEGLPFEIIREEGEGQRYYWITLRKSA